MSELDSDLRLSSTSDPTLVRTPVSPPLILQPGLLQQLHLCQGVLREEVAGSDVEYFQDDLNLYSILLGWFS